MEMILEQKFEFSGETKNMYTFNQAADPSQRPVMFPNKIYLTKELFKKKPAAVVVKIEEN